VPLARLRVAGQSFEFPVVVLLFLIASLEFLLLITLLVICLLST
jgi:hypothetical protein